MNEIKVSKDIVIRHVKLSDAKVFFDAEQDETAKMNFMRTPADVKSVEDDIREEMQKYKQKNPLQRNLQ